MIPEAIPYSLWNSQLPWPCPAWHGGRGAQHPKPLYYTVEGRGHRSLWGLCFSSMSSHRCFRVQGSRLYRDFASLIELLRQGVVSGDSYADARMHGLQPVHTKPVVTRWDTASWLHLRCSSRISEARLRTPTPSYSSRTS